MAAISSAQPPYVMKCFRRCADLITGFSKILLSGLPIWRSEPSGVEDRAGGLGRAGLEGLKFAGVLRWVEAAATRRARKGTKRIALNFILKLEH
jgi:hypothetical protein